MQKTLFFLFALGVLTPGFSQLNAGDVIETMQWRGRVYSSPSNSIDNASKFAIVKIGYNTGLRSPIFGRNDNEAVDISHNKVGINSVTNGRATEITLTPSYDPEDFTVYKVVPTSTEDDPEQIRGVDAAFQAADNPGLTYHSIHGDRAALFNPDLTFTDRGAYHNQQVGVVFPPQFAADAPREYLLDLSNVDAQPDWSVYHNPNAAYEQGGYRFSIYNPGVINRIVAERETDHSCFAYLETALPELDMITWRAFPRGVDLNSSESNFLRLPTGQYSVKGYYNNILVHESCLNVGSPYINELRHFDRLSNHGGFVEQDVFRYDIVPHPNTEPNSYRITIGDREINIPEAEVTSAIAERRSIQRTLLLDNDADVGAAQFRFKRRGATDFNQGNLSPERVLGWTAGFNPVALPWQVWASTGTAPSADGQYVTISHWRHLERIVFHPIGGSYGSTSIQERREFDVLSHAYSGDPAENKRLSFRVPAGRYQVTGYRGSEILYQTDNRFETGVSFESEVKRNGCCVWHDNYVFLRMGTGHRASVTNLDVRYQRLVQGQWTNQRWDATSSDLAALKRGEQVATAWADGDDDERRNYQVEVTLESGDRYFYNLGDQ